MSDLPPAIATYLCRFIAENHSLAYLLISKTGDLLSCGGHLTRYGLEHVQMGHPVLPQLPFLEGLLPLTERPLFLPFIKHEHYPSADVHVFDGGQGDWVLFLDAEDAETERRPIQQTGNLFSLMRQQQLQMLSDRPPQPTAPPTALPVSSPPLTSVDAVILCIHVGDFATPPMPLSAQHRHLLDLYWATIGESIWSESGVIAAWMGTTVMVIFGLWPTKNLPQQHAFAAGLRILEKTSSLQEPLVPPSHHSWGIGMLIRSVSSLPYRPDTNLSRMMLGLLAQQMPILMQWVTHATPHEIVIDAKTFGQLDGQQGLFVPSPLMFQEESVPQQNYAYRFWV